MCDTRHICFHNATKKIYQLIILDSFQLDSSKDPVEKLMWLGN